MVTQKMNGITALRIFSRSTTSVGPLSLNRLARDTVQPVQLAPLSQITLGSGADSTAAMACSSLPMTVNGSPSAAADPTQYFRNSRLCIRI